MSRYVFAASSGGKLARTLGTAEQLIFFQDDIRLSTVPNKGFLPEIFQKQQAEILFCGGIGNCMKSLLEDHDIQLVCGCPGLSPEEILKQWKEDTLIREENHTCADHGRTCGSCPGKY